MVGKFIKEADNVAGDILKDFREGLIFVGRALLVSTFIEDALRMWHQWHDHKEYIGSSWSIKDEIATFIVVLNLVGQCLGQFKSVIFRAIKKCKLKLFDLPAVLTININSRARKHYFSHSRYVCD